LSGEKKININILRVYGTIWFRATNLDEKQSIYSLLCQKVNTLT